MAILARDMEEEKMREAYVRSALANAIKANAEATPRVISELTLGRVSTVQANTFLSSGVGGRETMYLIEGAAAALGIWPPANCPFADLSETTKTAAR